MPPADEGSALHGATATCRAKRPDGSEQAKMTDVCAEYAHYLLFQQVTREGLELRLVFPRHHLVREPVGHDHAARQLAQRDLRQPCLNVA